VLLAEAWIFGALLQPPIAPVRTTLSAAVILLSVILAWSESWDYPPAFDPALYDRYRASRADASASA
jgi:hypothetical protein